MVNVTGGVVVARCWPPEPTMPWGPPGMVNVSVADGMNGAVGSKVSVVAFVRDQVPLTVGDSVGVCRKVPSGAENRTVIVEFDVTFFVPFGGVVDTIVSGLLGSLAVLTPLAFVVALEPPAAALPPPAPPPPPPPVTAKAIPAPAATTTSTATARIHGRRLLGGLCAASD